MPILYSWRVNLGQRSSKPTGDVWTNKGSYAVGRQVIIYVRLSEATIGRVKAFCRIKVNKPDGTYVSINVGSPATGTYFQYLHGWPICQLENVPHVM